MRNKTVQAYQDRKQLESQGRDRIASIRHRFPKAIERQEVGSIMPGWKIRMHSDQMADWLECGSIYGLQQVVKKPDWILSEMETS